VTCCEHGNKLHVSKKSRGNFLNNSVTNCISVVCKAKVKGKGLPQQAVVAQVVPGRLRPRIFLTFGTTMVLGRQPYAPAAFIPGESPGSLFRS
jgi:hypothetical protein